MPNAQEKLNSHLAAGFDQILNPYPLGSEGAMLSEAITLASKLERLCTELETRFNDAKGNLAEARDYAGNIMSDLAAQQRDFEAGVE